MSTTKTELRRLLRAQLHALSPQERQESDRQLLRRLMAHPWLEQAQCVFAFYGVGIEPHTKPLLHWLLAQGKRLCLPRVLEKGVMAAYEVRDLETLELGALDIPQPRLTQAVPMAALDLILVPNICCDRSGYRLGQGGGYYDRYLACYQGKTIALCRQLVLQDALPTEPFDRPVGSVLTEQEVLCFAERSSLHGGYAGSYPHTASPL